MKRNLPPMQNGPVNGSEATPMRRRWTSPQLVSQPFHRAALACFDGFCALDNQEQCWFQNPSQGNPFCLEPGCLD